VDVVVVVDVDMRIASAPAARLRYLGGFLGITTIGIDWIVGMDGTWGDGSVYY
jgi:hypothetical protein